MESPALPENIGPYRVTGLLGRGGMGEVLRGYDDRLDRPVALKRIHPGSQESDKVRQRFRREARAAARLSDAAIVQVYDWVEEEDSDWLVMELIEGRTLEEVLAEGLPTRHHALTIAREVASGLAAAHEAGFVHRDLKAANVMLVRGEGSAPDRVKILDFGIAKPVEVKHGKLTSTTLTAEGQLVGTINAMSPEQALGQPVDHRSDLFSLGVLLYEMLSGESPFAGRSAVETLSRICSWKQTALHHLDGEVPEEVSRFVDHLLAKDPARRPADARQVVAELNRVQAEPPMAPEPSSPTLNQPTLVFEETGAFNKTGEGKGPAAPGKWKVPRRVLVGMAAGLLVLAVGSWGLASWLGRPGQESVAGTTEATAQPPTDETELTDHELVQRGMASLERYDRKGNIDKAIADFQRALAHNSDSAPAYAGLARAYWLDTVNENRSPVRREQALAAAQRGVEEDRFLAFAWVSLGMVHLGMGRIEDAVRELEQALQIEPLNAYAWFELGKVSEAQHELQQAESNYRRAIEARPDFWLFHCQLGVLYHGAGRYLEAEKAFLRGLELAPDNYLLYRNLGGVYYMQGKLDEAATQFQLALQIQPDTSVYTNLGNIYFAKGLYPESVSAFEKAIESGGANFHSMWGNLGDAYRWTPDNEPRAREAYLRAIQLLNENLTLTPDSKTLRTQKPLYSAKLGECDAVPTNISAMADLAGKDAAAWFRLAVASEICGGRENALGALEGALQARFPITAIEGDPELLNLRQDVRYHRLIMRFTPRG